MLTSGFTLNFIDFANLTGRTMQDQVVVSGGTLTGVIDGGALGESNTLTGDNQLNTWTLDSLGGGTVTGIPAGFTNIDSVIGNAGADHVILSALFVSGTHVELSGIGGTDGFAGSAFDDPVPFGNTIIGFDNIDEITSSGNTDTLTGANAVSTWTISPGESGTVADDGSGNTVIWNNFDEVTGGTSGDQFDINNVFAGTIDGGDGNDTLNLTTGAGVGILRGGGGAGDTIAGPGDTNAWTVLAIDAGTIDGQSYSEIENLDGGAVNDTFTFNVDVSVAGIDGGAGTDELDFSPLGAAKSLDVGTLTNIERLVDTGEVGDELIGPNTSNTWNIDADGDGDINGILYFGWENLTGGNVDDTFNINESHSGNVAGGTGDDDFNLAATKTFTGTLAGGAGDDDFDFATSSTVLGTVSGGDGDDTFIFANLASINAGTLVALDGGNSDTGSAPGPGDILNFSAWVTAQTVFDGGDGSIPDGSFGAVTDVLVSSNPAEYDNINTIIGNLGGLEGPNQDNTWRVTGTDTGTLNGNVFNDFLLRGNAQKDDFFIEDGGFLSGAIDGGAGFNEFHADSTTEVVTVEVEGARNGEYDAAGLGSFDFTNIDDVFGGSAGITVNVTNSFAGTIDGEGGDDTFNLSDGVTVGVLSGGADNDTLVAIENVSANDWTIDAANGGDLGGLLFDATDGQLFDGMENLVGNTMRDRFAFLDGGSLSGSVGVDGGIGLSTNELDVSSITTQTDATLEVLVSTVNGFAGTVDNGVAVTDFDNINVITGGLATVAANVLTGPNLPGTTFSVTGSGAVTNGANIVGFFNFDNLTGGNDTDFFSLDGGNVAGTIDGGPGVNTLIGATGPNTWDIDGVNSGTLTDDNGANTFVRIQNLTGKGGPIDANDLYDLGGGGSIPTGIIDGLGGTDTIIGQDADTTWNITAANTGDSDDINSFVNIERLTGGDADDEFNLLGLATGTIGTITG